jgi:hypothetical protein
MYFGEPYLSEPDQPDPSPGGAVPPSGAGTLPYREALEETERKQREEYLRDCANVTVLQTLERQSRTPGERVRYLEQKLAAMPRIVRGHELLKELRTKLITGRFTQAQFRAGVISLQHAIPELARFPFPSGYGVGSLADETARAQCELSRARWEFMVWNRTRRIPGRLGSGFGQPPSPGGALADARRALEILKEIKTQLDRNFTADDEPGYLDRRRRLRALFQSVPKLFAQSLFERLSYSNDPLRKLFRDKLHPATQNEMMSILQGKLEVF